MKIQITVIQIKVEKIKLVQHLRDDTSFCNLIVPCRSSHCNDSATLQADL